MLTDPLFEFRQLISHLIWDENDWLLRRWELGRGSKNVLALSVAISWSDGLSRENYVVRTVTARKKVLLKVNLRRLYNTRILSLRERRG